MLWPSAFLSLHFLLYTCCKSSLTHFKSLLHIMEYCKGNEQYRCNELLTVFLTFLFRVQLFWIMVQLSPQCPCFPHSAIL